MPLRYTLNVRSIVELAFVPDDKAPVSFEALQDELGGDETAPILHYFEDATSVTYTKSSSAAEICTPNVEYA